MSDFEASAGGTVSARSKLLWLVLVLLMPAAVVVIRIAAHHEQARISPGVLPLVAGAFEAAKFTDCSLVNEAAYDPHNPCQTFVLAEARGSGSSAELLAAESSLLQRDGWRHARAVMVDVDALNLQMATRAETWRNSQAGACAYVTTRRAAAAEAKSIFPKDPTDIPQGVYDFLATAIRAERRAAVWIRLQPLRPWPC